MKQTPAPKTIDNPTDDGFQNSLRGVISEDVIKALQSRASEKAKKSAKSLGTRYVLHPVNRPKRFRDEDVTSIEFMLSKIFDMPKARGTFRANT